MESTEQPLMVIGHKNPDTDSICSAIAYAHYKRHIAGAPAVPYRAGTVNPQTNFVLNYFGVPQPDLVTTLLPKLSDIMIRGNDLLTLREDDPLGTAQDIITQRRFAFLPVTGADGSYAGKISALRLASLLQDLRELGAKEDVPVLLHRLIAAVDGHAPGGQVPDRFTGRIWFPGLTELQNAPEGPVLAVLPGSASAACFAEAVNRRPSLLMLCGRAPMDPAVATALEQTSIPVITTPRTALEVAVQLCLAMPVREFTERDHPTFKPSDLVREVQKEIRKSNEGGFIVVDDDGMVRGVVTRLSFLTNWRFRVALVDHNEPSQSVDGIEEASVEEIIDHHRLGHRGTDLPITFINRVVGCTCTIIAEMFRFSGQQPPREIAGLMLSAILSDTVILKSPTTTNLDREIAQWLAGLAGVELESYGAKMFAAGCAAEGMDPHKIIQQDLKVYEESGWKLTVSQMETVGFDLFKQMQTALAAELDRARTEAGCHLGCLMVTDITSSTSLLLCAGEESIISAVTYPKVGENLFEMAGVLSRKKQMMPYLADLLRRVPCS